MTINLDDWRRRGTAAIAATGWIAVLVTALAAVAQDRFSAAIVTAAFNIIPTWYALNGRPGWAARLVIGATSIGLPLIMLYIAKGSAFGTDWNLALLAALALLTVLWDARAALFGCVLLLAHHAVVFIAMPQLVHSGGVQVEIVAIHAFAIVLIGSLSCWIIGCVNDLHTRAQTLQTLSESRASELESKSQSLEDALNEVDTQKALNAKTRTDIMKVRKSEYESVASEFEQTISAVTHVVSETADMLARSAKGLRVIASQAGKEAQGVVGSAESASKAANTVAKGVAEISLSIADIAANVGQHDELTTRATERSAGGGSAIGLLTEQSRTIGEATRAIVRIAERTNLLSLNAAIEAASAGPSGRGFTIVAQEVKGLAKQASEAASEIEGFLKGVREGTVEAERSFAAIDEAIGELNRAARLIRYDVETQRQSADTIEDYARSAASEADAMVNRTRALSKRATAALELASELESASTRMTDHIRGLEQSADAFIARLRAA